MVSFYKEMPGLFGYNTSKVVHIRCKKIGLINRFLQLLIIGYVIGYAIIYKRGYQVFDEGLSSVTTKVKGIAHTNLSLHSPVIYKNTSKAEVFNQGLQTWDAADYVTPPEEHNAVFVMTNIILTPNQTQGKCPEYQVSEAKCENDSVCVPGRTPRNGHGVMTGKCVTAHRGSATKMCEIYGWCPVEDNELPMKGTNFGKPITNKTCLLKEAINFTIMIKNTVRFPQFDVTVRNIDDEHNNKEYLSECEHHPTGLCPIFRLKTIFEKIPSTTFEDMAIRGGVIGIKIAWDCNLDCHHRECHPEYSFYRLDAPNAKIAPGYNIRIAHYDTTVKFLKQRTLIKAYGIRFVVLVDAKAGKFSIVPLLTNFGAGLALLGLSTVLCDVYLLCGGKHTAHYRRTKYLCVDDAHTQTQASTKDAHTQTQASTKDDEPTGTQRTDEPTRNLSETPKDRQPYVVKQQDLDGSVVLKNMVVK